MPHQEHSPRILGGQLRGRPLRVPVGRVTRPARARVRRSVFDTLGDDVEGCAWLDLYAGSGSFGIEALSRGARHATFVESGRAGFDCLADNLRRLDLAPPRARILRRRLPELLLRPPPSGAPFERVSLDPPFVVSEDAAQRAALVAALGAAGKSGWLAPDSLLVWEEPARAPAPVPPGLVLEDLREFGTSRVRFFRFPGR